MFALKILFLNFQGWLLFNYQCSCPLSLCDSLLIISHLQSLVNNFFIFLFQEFLSFFDSQNNLPYFSLSVNNFLKFFFVVSATTRIIYHNFKGLSITFLKFLKSHFSVAYLLIHFKDFFVVINNFFPCFLR